MKTTRSRLWTRDFTIITIGSMISYFGNSVAGYAMSLVTLDFTGSIFLYSLMMVMYSLPKVITPLLFGPYLDRFSRKKVIYTLDFFSCGLYVVIALLLYMGWYNYIGFMAIAALIGTIDSVYQTAYESLYPSLISDGNYRKAYSVSSLMYPIASMVMIPVAAVCYSTIGLELLFLFNSVTFLIAAIFETQIKGGEGHLSHNAVVTFKSYIADFKEGVAYLREEKGLATITAYFFVSMMTGAIVGTVILPYFKGITSPSEMPVLFNGIFDLPFFKTGEALGVLAYSLLSSMNTVGRLLGGLLQYFVKYPTHKKFAIAVFVYTVLGFLECIYPYAPYELMLIIMLICGFLAVNSYNIRISATQNYVVEEKRGRFNGIFMMVNMLGSLVGSLVGGILGEFVPDLRWVIIGAMFINVICIFTIFVKNKRYVKPIYNSELN